MKNKIWINIFGDIHFKPDKSTVVVLVSYLLVVTSLYTAFQIVTTDRVAANFILFGPVTLAGLGVLVPVIYTVRYRKKPLSDLGITLQGIVPSLILSLFLGLDTYRATLATLDVSWSAAHVPLITMAITVGLFEAIFFRGWIQLRFESAFGMVPGIILGALSYSIYHIGYGMNSGEMLFLFGLGLVFAVVFRVTTSIFALWPFYTPVGGLYTNISEGLSLPFEASYGFLLTLGIMVVVIAVAVRMSKELPQVRDRKSVNLKIEGFGESTG
jgi:membrane protease YdiL (CAAX protease family)